MFVRFVFIGSSGDAEGGRSGWERQDVWAVCCSGHGLNYRSRDEALAQEEFLYTHYKRNTSNMIIVVFSRSQRGLHRLCGSWNLEDLHLSQVIKLELELMRAHRGPQCSAHTESLSRKWLPNQPKFHRIVLKRLQHIYNPVSDQNTRRCYDNF